MRPGGRYEMRIRTFMGGTSVSYPYSRALSLAGTEINVLAAAVNDNSLIILDAVTPANNYRGQLYNPATGLFNRGTFTRATTGWEFVNGVLTSFASNVPRLKTANGLTTFTVEDTATIQSVTINGVPIPTYEFGTLANRIQLVDPRQYKAVRVREWAGGMSF